MMAVHGIPKHNVHNGHGVELRGRCAPPAFKAKDGSTKS